MGGNQINITKVIDESKLSALNYIILGCCFLSILTEGFDVTAASYTAPGIIAEWGLSKTAFAPMLSITPLGMLFGSMGLGYLGDRFGRKYVIISALAVFGALSLASAFTPDINALVALRFIMGVAAGGLMTNNISLISEFTPARRRPGFVMMVAMGMTMGGITVALTSAAMPIEAWRTIFIIGGIAPLLLSLVLIKVLPELIKYLVGREDRQEEVRVLLRRLAPAANIPDDAVLVASDVKTKRKPAFSSIFAGRLALITPFIWLVFIMIQTANIGFSTWLPTLLHDEFMSHKGSAITASMYYFGGIFGSLTIGRLIDRFGFSVLFGTFLLGIPVVASVGIHDAPQWLRMVTVFLTGYAFLGTQLGTNTTGILYPPKFRSIGYGTASAVGRIGAVGGPLVFAWLMTLGLPFQILVLAPIIPLIIGAACALVVARLASGRFFGGKMVEVTPPDEVPDAPPVAATAAPSSAGH